VEESPLPKNISLDVDIDADGNVWIRNDDARIEGAVDLHLGGPLARAELTGRIRLFEGGTLRFRDVEYELTAGTVDFVDRRKVDPIIDLRAQTRVQEYEVFLHVEGTAEKFNYELTSDPPLSTQDIIALLLTGTTLESLTTAEGGSGFSGDLAANYFAGALTERLSKQLRQSLGLERLQINPLLVQGQADPTARVTVGKRVGEKVRVIYSVDLGSSERQIYQVEWQATRGFRLVAERDTTGGIGGDLRYAKRFGASHPAPRVAEPGESAEPAPAPQAVLRVAGLRVEGVPDDEAKRLLEMIAIRPGDPFRRVRMFEAGEAVRRRFVRAGRIEAKVRSEEVPEAGDADAVRLVFTVEQGPLVTVHLDGVDGRMRRRLGKRLEELWVESVFSQDLYDEGSQVVLRDLRSRGYYAADVDHEVLPEEGAKTVRYRIDPGSPVRVRKIFIEGNKAVGEDEIRLQMSTRPDSIFTRRLLIPSDLAADVRAISRLYQDRGMVEAKIDPPEVGLASDGKEAEVTVRIHEGPVYRVSEVEFPKDLPPDLDLTSPIGIAPGDVFSPTKLLEAESVVRTRLDAAGYPEARVEAVPGMSGGGVHVAFAIDADGRKRVGAIEIVGLTRTKEKIVRRELELQEGDWISRDKILMTQHRLYRLGIFRSVRIDYAPITGTDPSSQTLRIRLEEGPPYGVTVGGGYDTEAGPRATFSISDDNIGGRDRDLALQGRFSGIERRVQILAKEPRLFGRSIDAIATFFVEHQEEVGFTVDRRATALRLEKKIDPRWTRYIRYNFQRVDLTDVVDVAELFDQKLTNLRLGDVGIAVVRDSRDDPFLATRGGIASAEVRLFAKPFVSDSSFWKVFLQGSAIHTFPSGTAVAGALRLGASQPFGSTEAVPLSERFFAGGQATLRGFARDSVGPTVDGQPTGGEASLLLSEEFRYPIWGRLKGSIFIDAGNVYETLQKFDPTDLRETAGVGLRFETPIGPLRVEYGRKLDRRAGESEGEFFLAIGSAF
jgi:outer membrane protein insertion porin family